MEEHTEEKDLVTGETPEIGKLPDEVLVVTQGKTTETPSRERNELQKVRTYKGDIAETVKKQNASFTSIIAAEERRRTALPVDITEKKHVDIRKILLVSVSVLCILLGIGFVTYVVFFYQGNKPVEVVEGTPSLIFAESTQDVDTTGKTSREILELLKDARKNSSLPLGQILNLSLFEKVGETGATQQLTAEKFLRSIDTRLSDSFYRSLEKEFMLGLHTFNGDQPFMILVSNSYQYSFAGMLEWEPVMYRELSSFFGESINPQTGESITLTDAFEDRVIENVDTRVLLDREGEVRLLYAFPSQRIVIVTTNQQTLKEILTRMKSVRVF